MDHSGQPYLKRVLHFYFAPRWQSLLAIFHVLVFGYFTIFHLNNIWLAAKFLLYTLRITTSFLELSYLLWGVLFLLFLILPFAISLYAIFVPYEIAASSRWRKANKALVIAMLVIVGLAGISLSAEALKFIAVQDPIIPFIIEENILIGRPTQILDALR